MLSDDRFRDFSSASLRKDFISGITVGIVAIPLGMAFAMASGVKPEHGIYTTVFAGLIVALLGGSRFQIAGPTGAFIPILLAIVLQYGYEKLLVAGFLAGIMLIVMSFFRLGNLVHYIPRSVVIGFTAGIAVIIFGGQLGNALGLTGMEKKEYFHESMLELYRHLDGMNIYSILTAVIGLLVLLYIPKINPKVPVLLAGLVIPTVAAMLFFPNQVETIGTSFGGIPQQLPDFQPLDITLKDIGELWQPALVIAALGAIESLLSAVVADGMTGERHRSNRELFGQGVANLVTPLFGGIPATGAIARTATNIKSGAASPLSGVIHSAFVLVTLLLLAPYASYIPLAAMAPILMFVAWNMSEYKAFKQIAKLRTGDSAVLVVTFLLTVFVNLTVAVQAGILLSILSFIKKKSSQLQVERPKQEAFDLTAHFKYKTFSIRGPLFFGTAQALEHALSSTMESSPTVIILDMRDITIMDATGEEKLASFVNKVKKSGGAVLITGLPAWALTLFQKSGLYEAVGSGNFFSDQDKAIQSLSVFGKNSENVHSPETFHPGQTSN
ncbi:MAG TPA: SulP family inorganic anion transporter [Bacillaceae bacterium]